MLRPSPGYIKAHGRNSLEINIDYFPAHLKPKSLSLHKVRRRSFRAASSVD
jgi:hypothetical protein